MSEEIFCCSWYDELVSNGHTYSGEIAYQRHGSGSMRFANGKSLYGNWVNNIFIDIDNAKIEYDDSDCVYTGEIRVDDNDVYRDGKGTLRYNNNDKYVYIIGTWNNDDLNEYDDHKIKYKNGNIYVGKIYNDDIDDFYPNSKGTMTFNCKKSTIHQVIGIWEDGQVTKHDNYEIKYKNGNSYVGKIIFDTYNNNVFPYGYGIMTFNCSDSIIMSITGVWNKDIPSKVKKIVYNAEKIEFRRELNHSIRDAMYLPIIDEKSVLGKQFRKSRKKFNERNKIVCETNNIICNEKIHDYSK
jgi:hypothetical protein